MIALSQRQNCEVEEILCEEWQSKREPAELAVTLAAERMRAIIYGATVTHGGVGIAPSIHTNRLLASARQAVELLWPEFGHHPPNLDICALTLEQINDIGDAARIGSGQWLAAPLRIVAPKDGTRFLLVGAAPVQAVHQRLGMSPICAGTSRFVGESVCEAQSNDDLVISVDDWLGHQQPLAAWTAQALSQYEERMEFTGGLSAEQLELYAPDIIQAQHRTGRWIAAGKIGRPLNGPRLCRPQSQYGMNWDRPFYLAHFGFKDGVLTLSRAASVSRNISLRLRFGLDILLHTPRRVSIVRHHDTFSMDRPLTLPMPESRVYALGWKFVAQDSPDQITFHVDALPFVVHALQRLAVAPTIASRGSV